MEGGNKVKINLESPIDVKSSDMLVPVTNPKFAHNRQKYQGNVLPTSVRFEADGWAAGDDVYDIDVGSPVYEAGNYKVKRYKLKDNSSYILKIYNSDNEIIGNILFNAETYLKNTYNVTGLTVEDTSIAGTFAGADFIITVSDDIEDGKQKILFTSQDNKLSLDVNTDTSGMTLLTIYDDDSAEAVQFTYIKASDVTSESDVTDDYNMVQYSSTDISDGALLHLYKRADIVINVLANGYTAESVSVSGLENIGSVTDIITDENKVTFSFSQTIDVDINFSFSGATQIYELTNAIIDTSGQLIAETEDGESLTSKYSDITAEITGTEVSSTKGINLKVRVPFWSNFSIEGAPLNSDTLFGNTLTIKGCSAHMRKLFDTDLTATLYDAPDRVDSNGISLSRNELGTVTYNVYMLDYDPRFATQEYTAGMTADMSYVGLIGPAGNGTSAVNCFKNAKEYVTEYSAGVAAGSEFRADPTVAAEDNHLDLYLIRSLANWVLSNGYMPDGIDIEEVIEQYMGYIETLQADANLTTTLDDLISDNDFSIATRTINDSVQGSKTNKYSINYDNITETYYGTATSNRLHPVFSAYTYNTEGAGTGTGSGSGTNYKYNKAQCFTCIPYWYYAAISPERIAMTIQTGAFTIDTDAIEEAVWFKKVLCTGKLSLENTDVKYTPFNSNLKFYRGDDKYGEHQYNFSESHMMVVITSVEFNTVKVPITTPNGSVRISSGLVKWTSHSENAWTLLPTFNTLAYNGHEYWNTNSDPNAK